MHVHREATLLCISNAKSPAWSTCTLACDANLSQPQGHKHACKHLMCLAHAAAGTYVPTNAEAPAPVPPPSPEESNALTNEAPPTES